MNSTTFLSTVLLVFLILFISLFVLRYQLLTQTASWIKETKPPAAYRTAIVFGAGINPNLQPTKVLRDRLDKTIQLVEQDQLDRILLSGGKIHKTSESTIMYNYLIEHGIPAEMLVRDEKGNSTYDTLLRAKNTFDIQQAVLITQKFHLPRALAIAQELEMDVIGIAADTKTFRTDSLLWWNFRELFAWVWTLVKLRLNLGI